MEEGLEGIGSPSDGALAIGGGAAFLASDFLPEKVRPLAKIGGIGALVIGGLGIIKDIIKSLPTLKPESGQSGPSVATSGSLNDLRGAILQPSRGGSASLNWSGLSYPIKFSIRNTGDKPVTAAVRFEVKEIAAITGEKKSSVSTYEVTVQPGETKIIPANQDVAFSGVDPTFKTYAVAELIAKVGSKEGTLAATNYTLG